MPDVHLVDVNSLAPADLCNYLEHKFYNDIRQLLQTVNHYVDGLVNDVASLEHSDLLSVLIMRLQDETQQMIHNDELIIFPLIRNDKGSRPCPARKLPIEMMRQMHQKIMQVLEKISLGTNNYIIQSNWNASVKICYNEMYNLDQQLRQAIHIKENVLLHRVKDDFNGKCSGDCKKEKVEKLLE